MANPQPAGVVPGFEMRHRLARALEVAGLTRDEMAAELNVHRNTIGNYLNGKYVPRAVLIAWHLRTGVPLRWLEHGDRPDDNGGIPDIGAHTLGYGRRLGFAATDNHLVAA